MEQQTEKEKKQKSFGSILNQWTSFLMLTPCNCITFNCFDLSDSKNYPDVIF